MKATFSTCADELAEAVPGGAEGTFAAGGIVSKIMALVAALRAGDLSGILKAVYDLLGEFVNDDTTHFDAARLNATVAGAGMDWKTLLGILGTILGLLGK